jgi:hypothetical protein
MKPTYPKFKQKRQYTSISTLQRTSRVKVQMIFGMMMRLMNMLVVAVSRV